MPVVQLDEFKTRQAALWNGGEYDALSPYIEDVGEIVAARAEARTGMRLLDVACGTGNAAQFAAKAGAQVTGIDLATRLLEVGRNKARAKGLEIDFREGDAEDIPFEDASFDRVVSTFGHMFAPRHQQCADEMARVCRKGGAIVTATWTPEGITGDLFRETAAYMPPAPDYASPPIFWGRPDYVRERFADVAQDFHFERHVNRIVWESVEAFADYFMARFPPMVALRGMLGDRFGEVREKTLDVWRNANEAKDGTLRLPQEWLLSVVRL